jgi:hypothetical protein
MRQLREYYGLPKIPVRIKDRSTMVGVMERDLMDTLGCVRDIAEWYTALLLYPEYVHEVFDIENERAIESFKKYHDAFRNDIDVLFSCGTDFGSQRGPLMGVDTFRAIFMPHYKKVYDWVHLPSMIEVGIDGINPVRCSAEGMDPQKLKDTYGKDMVFWGGGVNTQKTLPFGTPEAVRTEVLERLEIFSKDGGYVFNTIHNIQANTSIPNIIAMIDAVKEFNGECYKTEHGYTLGWGEALLPVRYIHDYYRRKDQRINSFYGKGNCGKKRRSYPRSRQKTGGGRSDLY